MDLRLRKLRAQGVLAFLFVIHLLKKVFFFWRRPRGLSIFLGQYIADGIYPVEERERHEFPSFQKCQACSLCTFSCTAVQQGRAPSAFEPKFIMLGLGRSSHESEVFLEEWLPCIECGSCQVLCPNDVPIHRMAEQIIERRQRVGFRV